MKTRDRKYQVTWAQAIRDILIVAINKGQLLLIGCLFIVILIVYRIPESSIPVLLKTLVDNSCKMVWIPYSLLVLVIISWRLHIKNIRKKYSREYKRIGKEKSELQKKLSKVKFKSSD